MYRSPAEIPRARLPLLDQVTIKTPCRESWDGMTGDDRMRFCARCSKHVYDLSAMTQDEAETFLATHLDDDDTCVRLYRRPDGRVLTSECVQSARTRHARKVVTGVAAGLCATFAGTLALASVHVPSGMNLPKAHARIDMRKLVRVSMASEEPELRGDRQEDVTGASMGLMGFAPDPPPPSRERPRPIVKELKTTVSPGLPIDVVRRIVRQNLGRIALCYDNGRRAHPHLEGEVGVKFLIGRDGSVVAATDGGSTLPDDATRACIYRQFGNLAFPMPEPPGPVTVSYRVSLKPPP